MFLKKLLVINFLFLLTLLEAKRIPNGRRLQDFEELFFSITYRQFLPSACFYANVGPNSDQSPELIEIHQRAWGVGSDITPERLNLCSQYTFSAEVREAMNSGAISGHPDFESIEIIADQEECGVGENGVNFPVASCILERGFNFSIIQRDLQIEPNGLAMPVYCIEDDPEARCGFTFIGEEDNEIFLGNQTQTQAKFFETWYHDDLTFNKRIGQRLRLTLLDDSNTTFQFDSGSEELNQDGADDAPDFAPDANLQHFGPLDRFYFGDETIDLLALAGLFDPEVIPSAEELRQFEAWPRPMGILDLNIGGSTSPRIEGTKSFYITTELHTFFEFRTDEDMIFEFSGDDDFWAFINGKMVIDLGGLHEVRTATIDLNSDFDGQFNVAEFLGLENGEIYTLDVFHAERQTSESNFKVTTSLLPACNVQQSGAASVAFLEEDIGDFVGTDIDSMTLQAEFDPSTFEFTLQRQNQPSSSGYMYTTNAENVGQGFIASFDIKVSGITEGFAFVVQSLGVINLPITSGSTFNLRGITNSFAVVFDLCANRDDIASPLECDLQTVSVHHPDSPEEENSADNTTRRTTDTIARNFNRDEFIAIEIIHYGGRPNFLEVYIDGSLYLRENDFNITNILGSSGGHVGITATSSSESADIIVKNFQVQTVVVEPTQTAFVENEVENERRLQIESILADGEDESTGFTIGTADFCTNPLESGTLEEFITAFYVQERNSTSGIYDVGLGSLLRSNRLPSEPGLVPDIVPAQITDNDDGTYRLSLITSSPGDYFLIVAFGPGCDFEFSDDVIEVEVLNTLLDDTIIQQNEANITVNVSVPQITFTGAADECFHEIFNDGESVVFAERVFANATEVLLPPEGNSLPVALIAGIGGSVSCCALLLLGVLIGYRRKWFREKPMIAPGQLFRAEMNTRFNDGEYVETGAQVLKTDREILALQSKSIGNAEKLEELNNLKTENQKIKDQVRDLKQEMETGVDESVEIPEPDAPPPVEKPAKRNRGQRAEF